MLPGQTYTPEKVLRILWQRKWLIVLPLVGGLALGVAGYRMMPLQYKSETLIMVTPQQVPDDYVKSTLTATVQDRLRTVNEQIMSRSRLELVIRDFDLYPSQRQTGAMEDVVRRMTSDINVQLQPDGSTFRVSYAHADPQVAQRVTQRLADLYMQENVRDRERQALETQRFLEASLETARRSLLEQERKLQEYRQSHPGELPTQLAGNLQAIQSAQIQNQALNESMNRARERRLLIERQIADTEALPSEPVVVTQGGDNAVLTTSQQLEAARAQLDRFRQRYTPDHPDILDLEERVGELEAKVKEEAGRPASATKPRSPAEVARQKRLADLRAELDVIDLQLKSAQSDQDQIRARVGGLQAMVAAVPKRESELVELTRDYNTQQTSYTDLLKKLEDAKLSANLEQRQKGEQFQVIDPASLPVRPANERMRLMALAGAPAAGLMLGLLAVGFLEYRDTTFKSEDDVQRVLSLPVLALVPLMDEDVAAVAEKRPRSGQLA